jgi:hypothetical protein
MRATFDSAKTHAPTPFALPRPMIPTLFSVRILGLFLAVSSAGWAAELRWDYTEVRLNAREGDEKVEAVYAVKNTGDRVVRIENIDTGCGCTSSQFPGNQVLPGATAELKITFKLEGLTGPQSKIITVKTDEPGAQLLQLWLKVDIVSPVMIRPRMVFWRVGEAADPKNIEVVANPGEDLVFGEAVCDIPGFTAEWVPSKKSGVAYLSIKPVATTQAAMCPVKLTVYVQGRKKVLTLYALVR